MRRTLLTLSVLFVAFAQAQSPSPSKKTDQPSADQGRSEVNFWFLIPGPNLDSDKHKETAKEQTGDGPSWSNWALVIVGIIGAGLALRTLNVLSKQADANKIAAEAAKRSADTLINTERGWLILEQLTDGPAKFMFSFKNYGRTPVWVKESRFTAHTSTDPKPNVSYADIPIQTYMGEATTPQICAYFDVLLNGDGVFTEEDKTAIRNGELFVHFFGALYYSDIFGSKCETRVCYTQERSIWRRSGKDGDNECI